MTQVNSPFLIKKLRPREAILEVFNYSDGGVSVNAGPEVNNYLDQLERIIEQIYRRIGGGSDAVSDSSDGSIANSIDIAILKAKKQAEPIDDNYAIMASIHRILSRLDALEKDSTHIDLTHILKRLEDLEAQQ